MFAQNIGLHAVEAHHFVGSKTPVIEPMRRMRLGHGTDRRIDLVEASIFHAPEHGAPRGVQCIDTAVALPEPCTEALRGPRRIAAHGVMATVYVVGLPECDGRMRAITSRHRVADAACRFER